MSDFHHVAPGLGRRRHRLTGGVLHDGHLGVRLGGRVDDSTGGHGPVWTLAVVLGVAAALVHLPIARSPETVELGQGDAAVTTA